jgi:hypothetical protein
MSILGGNREHYRNTWKGKLGDVCSFSKMGGHSELVKFVVFTAV